MDKPLDQRALHLRRETAMWNTKIAAFAAFASAALAVIVFVFIGVDTGDWATVAPYLVGAAITIGLGAAVYHRQSQLAAGLLLVLSAATLILRVIQTGRFGGVVVGAAVIYCYFRGLSGAMDLTELGKCGPASISERAI